MPKVFKIVKDKIPSLRKKCEVVENPNDPAILQLIDEMHDYLVLSQDQEYAEKHHIREGVGLAAPQIGQNVRMLVVYYKDYVDDKEVEIDHRLINPKIVSESVKKVALSGGEGCLSVDDAHPGYVYRPYKIIVKAFDAKQKKEVFITARGYESIVLQHELDHLDGVLFYDHINKKDPFERIENSEII